MIKSKSSIEIGFSKRKQAKNFQQSKIQKDFYVTDL